MARAGDASLGEAAERSHEASGEVSDEVSGEVSDEVSDWASDGVSDGVSDDYGAFKEGNPSEAAGLTGAAEAAALEGSVDNVIDGPYSPAPYCPASPRTK